MMLMLSVITVTELILSQSWQLTRFIEMSYVRMSKLCSDVWTCQQATENKSRQANNVHIAMYTQHLTVDRLQADTQPQWIVR